MSVDSSQLIKQLAALGPKQFAAWDAAAWESYVDAPFSELCRYLEYRDEDKVDDLSISNYLQMVFQGVGLGWLNGIDEDSPPSSFLAYCLAQLIPYQLMRFPPQDRPKILLKTWNLAEGLTREPLWLNRYVIARTPLYDGLDRLDQHLAQILKPVLSPLPPANWDAKLALSVIDFRHQHEEFVPGTMYLAAPAVLCVQNRIRSTETLAVLLQKSNESTLLGSVGKLPEYTEAGKMPEIQLDADSISINGKQIAAPLIHSPREHLCVASGFVAVSAEDSQRLWLVETQ